MMISIKPNVTNAYPPISDTIFYKNKSYQYQSRELGKLLSIRYEERYSWNQWRFEFKRETMYFGENDPCIKDIVLCVKSPTSSPTSLWT